MVQKRISFISFDDFTKLYKFEKDKEIKLCILLGFGSGLRISEIVGFKRKSKINIPPLTKDKIDIITHQVKIDDGKGKKWRITITPPSLTNSMIEILPLKIKRRTLQLKFEKLCQEVLGKKMSFHTLRHGFGNYQANTLNVPLPIVQQMMGHSRLDTTGIYTKANPEESIKIAWKAMGG